MIRYFEGALIDADMVNGLHDDKPAARLAIAALPLSPPALDSARRDARSEAFESFSSGEDVLLDFASSKL